MSSAGEMGRDAGCSDAVYIREMEVMATKELVPPGVKDRGWKIRVFHYKPFCGI